MPERTQVLVLGLDGSGKTSLLHCFSGSGPDQEVAPTRGFNAVSISRDDLNVEFLESRSGSGSDSRVRPVPVELKLVFTWFVSVTVGGQEDLRPFWQRYLSKALLLVFVVDSSDPKRFPDARKHLQELLTFDPRLPLMVLVNKQVKVLQLQSADTR